MNKLIISSCILISFLCVASCNPGGGEKPVSAPPESKGFDKQWAKSFIDSINLKFTEQVRSGDSVALASHYWPDAELLLDNMETVEGDAILPAWGSLIRMGVTDFILTTTDLTGENGFVIETGQYQMKDARHQLIDRGKYVVVWQKRKGEWKLYRDIGNTSLPPVK